jgi:hypothetical protein
MAFTSDQLAAYETAIASGLRAVTLPDGKVITYQSTAEMLSALNRMRADVQAASGKGRRTVVAEF